MKYFSISIYIRGRKKVMRGVRAFPAAYSGESVREAMAEMLLYYYLKNDILQIDVVPIEENNIKEPALINKKLTYVCL
jgi:hypothetical protein